MSAETVIATLCRQHGDLLRVPGTLDPAKVLWALAGCESGFGVYALPRHEPAYCNIGHGRYDIPALSRRWGCAAHCSYGPWQMMFCHLVTYLPHGADPGLFVQPAGSDGAMYLAMARLAIQAAITMLNLDVLGREQAQTLPQIAKAWNHGDWRDQFGDSTYVERAVKFYATPFPQEADHAPAH